MIKRIENRGVTFEGNYKPKMIPDMGKNAGISPMQQCSNQDGSSLSLGKDSILTPLSYNEKRPVNDYSLASLLSKNDSF